MGSKQPKRSVKERELVAACLLVFSFLLASPGALACSCAPFPAAEAEAVAIAYGRADVIFLGVATRVKSKIVLPLRVRDTTFELIAFWKGMGGDDEIVVRAAISEMACGFEFRKGGRYLVFANWNPDNGTWWTSMCELTRHESQGQGLIKELDALKRQKEAKFPGAEVEDVLPN